MTPATDPPLSLAWWLSVPVACAVLAAVVLGLDADVSLVFDLNAWRTVPSEGFWANVTVLGDGAVMAALMLPFAGRHPRLLWAVLLAVLLALIVGQTIELIYPRDRPPAEFGKNLLHVVGPRRKHNGFPSGHTLTVFMAAALWVRVWCSSAARTALVLGAALAGLSRVVVGVHWPTDVLAGATLGWLAGHTGWWLAARWPAGQRLPTQRFVAALLLLVTVSLYFDDSGFDRLLPVQLLAATLGLLLGLPGCWRLMRRAPPA